jgi:hypothetical protein
MYEHSHSPCNIRPVKLVDIVGKWSTAHKSLETLREQFNRIRSNVEKDFPSTSSALNQDQHDLFSVLRERFAFFSDDTALGIATALGIIEEALKPLHTANPLTECAPCPALSVCFQRLTLIFQF